VKKAVVGSLVLLWKLKMENDSGRARRFLHTTFFLFNYPFSIRATRVSAIPFFLNFKGKRVDNNVEVFTFAHIESAVQAEETE
jgi:hypothetical protein